MESRKVSRILNTSGQLVLLIAPLVVCLFEYKVTKEKAKKDLGEKIINSLMDVIKLF